MQIDFFSTPCEQNNGNCKKENIVCKAITNEILFGLIDDKGNDKKPAFIDFINNEDWEATIKNPHKKEITFKAIDNCVLAYRENGELIKRCEGFLVFDSKILFIELKQRKRRGWLTDARKKFEETILVFKENNHDNNFEILAPVIANRKSQGPPQNKMTELKKLRDAIGVGFVEISDEKITITNTGVEYG